MCMYMNYSLVKCKWWGVICKWTSDQLNFIVGSKTINENTMDTNLERLGINQKNKKKIKATTAKANIHGLLNILKAYYANTHQDPPKLTINKGTDDLQLVIDTRQDLGKHPPHTNHDGTKSPTRPLPSEGKRTKRPVCTGAYASVIPQVNYTEGSAPNNPPRPARTLLKAPSLGQPHGTRITNGRLPESPYVQRSTSHKETSSGGRSSKHLKETKIGCHLRQRGVTTDRTHRDTFGIRPKPNSSRTSPRDAQTLTTPGLM
jgi:hypothetical protein